MREDDVLKTVVLANAGTPLFALNKGKKKRSRIKCEQPLFTNKNPACAVFTGIPNQTVQGGHS